MQKDDMLSLGEDWSLLGKNTTVGHATHHELLLVRKFQFQTVLCGYFGFWVCEAAMQASPELVGVTVWLPFLSTRKKAGFKIHWEPNFVKNKIS